MSRSSSREQMIDALRQANEEIVSLKAMLETFVTKLDATTAKVHNVEAMLATRREEGRKAARSEESTVASSSASKKKLGSDGADGESRPEASDRRAASRRDESDRAKQMRLTRDNFPVVRNWMVDVGAVKLGDNEHNMLEEAEEDKDEKQEVHHPKEERTPLPPSSAPRPEPSKKIEYIAW